MWWFWALIRTRRDLPKQKTWQNGFFLATHLMVSKTISGGLKRRERTPVSPTPEVTKNFVLLYSPQPLYHFAGVMESALPIGPKNGRRIWPPWVCPKSMRAKLYPVAV